MEANVTESLRRGRPAPSLSVEWADQVYGELAASSPAGNRFRENALSEVRTLGIPTTKREEWRYTNIRELATGLWQAPDFKSSHSKVFERRELDAIKYPGRSGGLIFVDGYYRPDLSEIPDGIAIEIEATNAGPLAPADGERFYSTLGSLVRTSDSPLAAMNSAFLVAPVRIRITGQMSAPLQLSYISGVPGSDAQGRQIVSPRLSVHVATGAKAQIVETYTTLAPKSSEGVKRDGNFTYLVNAVTELFVEPDAECVHTKIQNEDESALHCASLWIEQGDRSKVTSNVFHFGGQVVRNEIFPVIAGSEAECYLNGLTVLTGEQHVDNFTVIDHAVPNSFSREVYKGVYDDRASGAFSGTIIVRKDAQKTNAIQSNQSILLSKDATSDSRPQLKIWADDVKCTHGATVGQLDENALFYLRSRGIPEQNARNLLLHAFVSEVIYHLEEDAPREHLEALLLAKLGGRIE